MKKLIFLICMMLATTLTFAQEVKRVAILEVVDREGRLSYSQKLLLRSNMARAVSNTTGYEAYDRSDVDMIMSEHEFQRTGLVSENEIRKLGEMTGVSLILVTEGALIDANRIFVTAKILNVETGRIESQENELMGTNAFEIQNGCQVLAQKLIKVEVHSKIQEAQGHQEYFIEKVSKNEYNIAGQKLSKDAYEQFIYKNCPEAWKKYTLGNKCIAAGWSLFGIGVAGTVIGIIGLRMPSEYGGWHTDEEIMLAGFCIGGPVLLTGLICLPVGYGTKNNAYKEYNQHCAERRSQLSVNLTASQNGLGIALNF